MTSKRFIITAGTEINAPVYWTRPEGHDAEHEPDLLLRLCDFVEVLHGEPLIKFAEIMFMITQRTETALFIEKEEGRFVPLVFSDDESKIPYHCLWFSYRDCVLLMLQIHYHYMACALKQKTDHSDNGLFMTRAQLIDRAKKLYPMEPAHRTLIKLDQLELRTSQILQTFFPLASKAQVEHLHQAHGRRMRYLAATHQIMTVLVQKELMYINMVNALDPSRIEHPLATTFLSVMLEGLYVYHLSDKKLYVSNIQRDAGTRLSTMAKKGEIVYRILGDGDGSPDAKEPVVEETPKRTRSEKKRRRKAKKAMTPTPKSPTPTPTPSPSVTALIEADQPSPVTSDTEIEGEEEEYPPPYAEPHMWCTYDACPCHERFIHNACTKDISNYYAAHVARYMHAHKQMTE